MESFLDDGNFSSYYESKFHYVLRLDRQYDLFKYNNNNKLFCYKNLV